MNAAAEAVLRGDADAARLGDEALHALHAAQNEMRRLDA